MFNLYKEKSLLSVSAHIAEKMESRKIFATDGEDEPEKNEAP